MAEASLTVQDASPPVAVGRLDSLVIAVFGLVLLLPSWLWGVGDSHSAGFNAVWARQFSEQLLSGQAYPRWLEQSYGGLGGPAFYFYPPLAFYGAGLVDAIGLGRVPVTYQIGVASTLFLIGSGLAMHAWLKGQTSRGWALVGALAYMAAPYHLIDHYVRGAFAEFAAYALLPLVALGLRGLADRRLWAWIVTPAAFAGLILAHLPTALLASLIFAAYGAHLAVSRHADAVGSIRFLAKGAWLAILGAGLAAAYWAPALTLTDAVSSEHLWSPYYRPGPWLLLFPARWPNPGFMTLIALAAAAMAAFAATALWAGRRSAIEAPQRDARFWACAALAGVALVAGLIPFFWGIPLFAKVQFPWRMLSLVEFAAISAVALALWGRSVRALGIGGALAGALAGAALAVVGGQATAAAAHAASGKAAQAAAKARDVSEYLPAGFFGPEFKIASMQRWESETDNRLAWAVCVPEVSTTVGARASIVKRPHGAVRIVTEAGPPSRIVLRRFAFPAWQVIEVSTGKSRPVSAFGPNRLLSFQAEPGRHVYEARITPMRIEYLGWLTSALSVALCAAGVWAAGRTKKARRN